MTATAARHGGLTVAPYVVGFTLYPVWWLLGLAWLTWPVAAAVAVVGLGARRRSAVPPGFWLVALVLYGSIGTIVATGHSKDFLGWAFHSSGYFAGAVFAFYAYNDERVVAAVRRYVVQFWVIGIAGAYVGIADPHLGFESVGQRLVGNQSYLGTLASVRFSSPSNYGVPRPSAPFVFANKWGSVIAISTPVVAVVALSALHRLNRWLLALALLGAAVPIVYSLNRTLWAALAFCAVYAVFWTVRRGKLAATYGLLLALLLFAVAFWASGLADLALSKLVNGHSQAARGTIYAATWQAFRDSPIVGHAGTGSSQLAAQILQAPVGTQGQFWSLLYGGGLLSIVPFYAFYAAVLVRTRRLVDPLAVALRASLLVTVGVSLFYSLDPDGQVLSWLLAGAVLRMADKRAHRPTFAQRRHSDRIP